MTLIAAYASYFLKKSSGADSLAALVTNKWLWLGGFMYVTSACINIFLLRRMDYIVVVSMGAISYIWTMLISHRILGEKVNLRKITGVFLVIIGIICITI